MPLVIIALGSGHTDAHTYQHANQSNFKKPGTCSLRFNGSDNDKMVEKFILMFINNASTYFSVPNKILLLSKRNTCRILYKHAFNTLRYNNLVIVWTITDIRE